MKAETNQKPESPNETSARPAEEVRLLVPEREWPYRLAGSLILLLIIGLIAGLIVTFRNDLLGRQLREIREDFYLWAGRQGLTVEDVIVSGRRRTTLEEINQTAMIKRGDNLLMVDPFALREKLLTLPWIKSASVKRSFFPNIIEIRLQEKEVRAIWQLKEKFYPIDEDGKVIAAPFRAREPILLIVGEGAPEKLGELLQAIGKDGDRYLKRIKVANLISGRRWNLVLDDIQNGITIKLPEEGIDAAWNKLLKLNESKGILKRKLTIIDLRLTDKIVVKLRKNGPGEKVKLKKAAESRI